MNFSEYKNIILGNKYIRITIIYDFICCLMLLAALFIFDTKRNFISVMFCYSVPIMCAAIFGMYIVSMSANRKICLLFPSVTYILSLLIYALLADDIPLYCLSLVSFVPLLFFCIHIFTNKLEKLCVLVCSAFVIFVAVASVAVALFFVFAMFRDMSALPRDVYELIKNNLGTIEVGAFSACSLAPFTASYISAIRAVSEEERKARSSDDRTPPPILT